MKTNGKHKTQRAIITFTDNDEGKGCDAKISFEPSIKDKTGESACLNAAARIWSMIQHVGMEELSKPLPVEVGQEPGIIASYA